MHVQDVFASWSSVESGNSDTDFRESLDGSEAYEAMDRSTLRILLVVESSAGGTGRHVLDLAQGFIKRGHQVHLAHSTIRIDNLFKERLAEIRGLSVHGLPMRTAPHPGDYSVVRAIRKIQSLHGPFDIVHGHSSKGGALARMVALGSGAKAFYTLHGMNSMDPGLSWWKSRLYVSIERALAMCTHGIITVSPEEARAATSIGLGGTRTRTIPNGVDQLELASRADARREMGIKGDELVVGFVGRLVEQKAPEVLLDAFASVVAAVPNARLAIVGDGPLLDEIVELGNQLGVGDKIVWLGARDAREVLAGFDLFALSSRKEGLPYVILEAMAAGLPVVATSSSGVELLIDPGVNGSVVPPDNSAAFAQALIHLLKKPSLLARFGAASSRLIGRFTIDRMVESTLSFYRSSFDASTDESFDVSEVAAM